MESKDLIHWKVYRCTGLKYWTKRHYCWKCTKANGCLYTLQQFFTTATLPQQLYILRSFRQKFDQPNLVVSVLVCKGRLYCTPIPNLIQLNQEAFYVRLVQNQPAAKSILYSLFMYAKHYFLSIDHSSNISMKRCTYDSDWMADPR